MKKAKKQTSLQQHGVDGDDDEVVDIIAEQRAAAKAASNQQQNKSADDKKEAQVRKTLKLSAPPKNSFFIF